jgi:hypothetical protein
VCERANRTVKEQFESEVRQREELLTLDELNAGWEAWVAEPYHRDVHSETGQAPFERKKHRKDIHIPSGEASGCPSPGGRASSRGAA